MCTRNVTTISTTMGKRNLIHRFSMWLLVLLTVTSCISAKLYHIVPNDSTSQCQNYAAGTCFTLAEFALNITHFDQGNNLTISFLPGEHLLSRRLTITGPLNIILTGQNSSNSSTVRCQGTSGFEFIDIQSLNIEYLKFTGCGNVSYGGAIYVNRTDRIIIKGCHFIDNHVTRYGGALRLENTMATNVEASVFNKNSARNNESYGFGGAISIKNGSLFTNNSNYTNNNADSRGGAIVVEYGNISSTTDYYINNNVDYRGGAINIYFGNITSTNDHYINNSAYYGGAIFMYRSSCKLFNDCFKLNRAFEAAVIITTGNVLEIGHTNITDNFASNKHNLNVKLAKLTITEGVNFMNNRGSLYITNTQIEIQGAAAFGNNEGDFGGAITAVRSQIVFNTASMVTIFNNTAILGGGMYLAQSDLQVYYPFELADNKASEHGGGIYASGSEIQFAFEHTQKIKIFNNTARNGGATCAIASIIQITRASADFNSNRAKHGGAIYLGQNSKIQLQKTEPDYVRGDRSVRLEFTTNSAEKGGAIYVADNTNDGVLCQGASTELHQQQAECFIQTLKYDHLSLSVPSITYINTFFTDNTALQSGSDIYGGQLDRCTISLGAELVYGYPEYKNSFGFDYIKATTQIEQIIDYSQYARSHPDYLIKNISKFNVLGLISSDGILKFCVDNIPSPDYTHPNVLKYKGELFTVSVAVVDQVENPVNATVSSSLSSESGNSHFKRDQVEQQVGTGQQCTELEYNAYSQDNSAQMHLHLYPEGHCGNIEVSRLSINLTFLPCECSVGLQPSSSQTECICECDRRLTQLQITSCFAKNGTIQVETNIWIGLSNSANGTGFVIHNCPFDYCVQKPVNISLNSSDSADKQCAYNRTGSLCGMCKDLSLVFGSSRCQECSSYYIFLLIPFALAGIALVAFILLFNMTVATGTSHGLILYANILTANHSLFVPFATQNVLTVFVSWLNLDLGIETCFYDGMDSYGKFLLQLAFPTFVFVLIVTIIVLCEVSSKFAILLGNRNPVAALCTLNLLSYSKLIRTIITALQFTHLNYPDGSREIVWLYDANIFYFTVSHIPRFIAAFIIVILGTIYTILLLFGQWFPRCSDRKFMKWTKNTRYNAFIDAYHAPFTPRHRYWMGLLLFALTTHNIVAAMSADSPAPILSAGCISVGLILLRVINTRIYKNRMQDSLETLFLTNIVILAIATLYNIIRETNENQLALANTSMAISFILFLIILGFHFYKYILKGTRVWTRVTQCCQRRGAHNRCHLYQFPPLEDEEPILNQDTPDSNNQLREPALDILDPVHTDDYRDPPPSPVISKRPKITYTVIDNRSRSGHRDGVPVPTGQND